MVEPYWPRSARAVGGPVSEQPASGAPAPREVDVYVGRRLRQRREVVGLSQGRLGRQLGVTFSQVQKYERGLTRIGAGRLYGMAALLGVPVGYFFEGLEEKDARDAAAGDPPAIDLVEAAQLQEAFSRIADPEARHALLSLASSMVKQISRTDKNGNGG